MATNFNWVPYNKGSTILSDHEISCVMHGLLYEKVDGVMQVNKEWALEGFKHCNNIPRSMVVDFLTRTDDTEVRCQANNYLVKHYSPDDESNDQKWMSEFNAMLSDSTQQQLECFLRQYIFKAPGCDGISLFRAKRVLKHLKFIIPKSIVERIISECPMAKDAYVNCLANNYLSYHYAPVDWKKYNKGTDLPKDRVDQFFFDYFYDHSGRHSKNQLRDDNIETALKNCDNIRKGSLINIIEICCKQGKWQLLDKVVHYLKNHYS